MTNSTEQPSRTVTPISAVVSRITRAIIVAASILAAGHIISTMVGGGFYQVVGTTSSIGGGTQPSIYPLAIVLNKFTGKVSFCRLDGSCKW
jgi:hypothetical protein